jgi:hypothetical protein
VVVYSTCRDCGGLLHVTDNDTVHPSCTTKPTKAERLAQRWLAAIDDEFTADALEYDIEAIDTKPPRLLAAALRYASWGWPVFPLKAHAKTPATRNGFKDAGTDTGQIRAWWDAMPEANIGLPTGLAFDVIDIDPPIGALSYTALLEAGHIPECHGQVATSSGGLHLYIPATGDGNRAGVRPGIDYRGVGGYVVAPPSTLGERGRAWSWISAPSPVLTGTAVAA